MQRLGHTLLVGEAAKIRAMVVRKTKTDRRDARHLLDLLHHDRFPAVWMPDPATRDLRALVAHRIRLVRMRTMVKNGLQAIALNQRLAVAPHCSAGAASRNCRRSRCPRTRPTAAMTAWQLLAWLDAQIHELDDAITGGVAGDPDARRLITHPGVGALTALATVVVLGPVARFHDSKHVVSYVGLAPAVNASADKQRLGHITKQGSALLRWVLGQAASHAARMDADLRRLYFTVMHRRGRPKAKVAVARKLLVRLFIMLRDQIDYDEFRRRGRGLPAPASGVSDGRGALQPSSQGMRSSAGVLEVIHGRVMTAQSDWDAPPRRSADRRRSNTTSCAVRARMDGWWTRAVWDSTWIPTLERSD